MNADRIFSTAARYLLLTAALVAGIHLHGGKLSTFELEIDNVERSLLPAASSKSGSSYQESMEKQLTTTLNLSRAIQSGITNRDDRNRINVVSPVMVLQKCFSELKQGKERAKRNFTLKRTGERDFIRAKRNALNKLKKSDATEEQKAREIERIYDGWLADVRDNNMKRVSRIQDTATRTYYEEYISAIYQLRRTTRQLRREKIKIR